MNLHDISPLIRPANIGDRDELRYMQALAMRVLGRPHYAQEQIEGFLSHIGTMDDFVLSEGTYYVAEIGGSLVASGGWSRRTPRYANVAAGDGAEHSEAAVPTIRSVFVHSDWARRGLARRLMGLAEAEARRAGYRHITLTATLSGAPVYRALGYEATGQMSLSLPGGLEMPLVPMRKPLVAPAQPPLMAASSGAPSGGSTTIRRPAPAPS